MQYISIVCLLSYIRNAYTYSAWMKSTYDKRFSYSERASIVLGPYTCSSIKIKAGCRTLIYERHYNILNNEGSIINVICQLRVSKFGYELFIPTQNHDGLFIDLFDVKNVYIIEQILQSFIEEWIQKDKYFDMDRFKSIIQRYEFITNTLGER